jgi:hypothetical protein
MNTNTNTNTNTDTDTTTTPMKITPTMGRPTPGERVRTGLRAGLRDGGVTHTDNWREIARR